MYSRHFQHLFFLIQNYKIYCQHVSISVKIQNSLKLVNKNHSFKTQWSKGLSHKLRGLTKFFLKINKSK